MEMFLNVLLYYGQHNQSIGERVAVGVLTGLAFSVFLYWNNKREQKKAEQQQKQLLKKQTYLWECQVANAIFGAHPFDGNDEGICLQLKEKCNPQNFLEPYDARKVEISNDIYSKLDAVKDDSLSLKGLRDRAVSELGISYQVPNLYENLCSVFNPQNFVGANYDADKLKVANKYYVKIQENKDNVLELERIYDEVSGESKRKDAIRNEVRKIDYNLIRNYALLKTIIIVIIMFGFVFVCLFLMDILL